MYEVQFKNIGGLETINKIFDHNISKERKYFFTILLIEIEPLEFGGFLYLIILKRITKSWVLNSIRS